MAAFCARDPRCGVALCDWTAPRESLADSTRARLRPRPIWIPARAPAGRSPGHALHDAFWSRLEERGVPFVLHVGSGAFSVGEAWLDDGKSARVEEGNRPEVIGSKDLMVIYQPIERFLSMLRGDRVLSHGLRGGAIEVGGLGPRHAATARYAVIWASRSALGAFERTGEQAAARLPSRPTPSRTRASCAVSQARGCTCSPPTSACRGGRDPVAPLRPRTPGHSPEVIRRFYAGNAAGGSSDLSNRDRVDHAIGSDPLARHVDVSALGHVPGDVLDEALAHEAQCFGEVSRVLDGDLERVTALLGREGPAGEVVEHATHRGGDRPGALAPGLDRGVELPVETHPVQSLAREQTAPAEVSPRVALAFDLEQDLSHAHVRLDRHPARRGERLVRWQSPAEGALELRRFTRPLATKRARPSAADWNPVALIRERSPRQGIGGWPPALKAAGEVSGLERPGRPSC